MDRQASRGLPGTADAILAAAAGKGMDLRDLAALAAEIQSRATPPPDPGDPDPAFEDRAVRLETTFQGAGVLSGDLTPECTALVDTVLEALSAPQGAEDTRTHEQRYHDGLAEAMRRLLAAGLLPERAGQPAKAVAHISLADLMVLDGDSALQEKWTERVRAQWAGHRAAASVAGGDGAAWLDGDAAEGFACDASVTPVVFGDVNPAVLDDLVRLCVEFARYSHGHRAPGGSAGADGSGDPPRPPAAAPRPPPRTRPPGPGFPGPGFPGLVFPGGPGAADHREGGGAGLGSGRAGLVLAAGAARGPAGRAEPAAGRRVRRQRPGRDPERGQGPGHALSMGGRLPSACCGV